MEIDGDGIEMENVKTLGGWDWGQLPCMMHVHEQDWLKLVHRASQCGFPPRVNAGEVIKDEILGRDRL